MMAKNTSDIIDRELAMSALKKREAGGQPNSKELAALRRIEKAREEEARWKYYKTIPQKHWVEMSGRQAKVINEQAVRYGIPFSGKEINLPMVVRSLHDFLATNKYKYLDIDPELQGEDSPALERLRMAKAEMTEIELSAKRNETADVQLLKDMLMRFFQGFKRTAEALQRQYGDGAAKIFEDGRRQAEAGMLAALDDTNSNVIEDETSTE